MHAATICHLTKKCTLITVLEIDLKTFISLFSKGENESLWVIFPPLWPIRYIFTFEKIDWGMSTAKNEWRAMRASVLQQHKKKNKYACFNRLD